MTSQAAHDREPQAALPAEPYVGLRPFRRGEEDIFVGRGRDARRLSDKVFSSKLTLLFAGSGVGKSSLLRTLVIPQLEVEESWVFYFKAWSSEQPLEILKSQLVAAATAAGIPSAGDGSPSLTELVRLLASIDERTIVLVLDQFEELLTTHSHDLDPIKAEIAALARVPALDVRILLSMREEYLAGMESFRGDIVGLFQSTFKLATLGDAATFSAIADPPQAFGGECEPGLERRIVADLRRLNAASDMAGADPESPVNLPMLQLVCQELWKRAQRVGDRVLSSKLYDIAGGAQKIIGDYVAGVMPKRWPAKKRTARLLLQLAPPNGFKTSFAAVDLAKQTGLHQREIEQELQRLSKASILRSRKWRQNERYELQHDSLIGILSPWRDDILKLARTVRLLGWFAAAAMLAAVFVGSLFYLHRLQQKREFFANTEGLLSDLKAMPQEEKDKNAEAYLISATGYVLWRRSDPERHDDLRDLLERYASEQPPGYGVETGGLSTIIDPPEDWPLRLRYSSRRRLDHSYFNLTWRGLAQSFAQSWGIPVPLRVLPQNDTTYPKLLLTLEGPEIESLKLEAPAYEKDAFISEAKLAKPSKEFLEHFRGEWTEIEEAELGGPWRVVPRWSLPVWKASGQLATDGSGLPAFLLALKLQKNPDRLVSKSAVDLLLQRVAERFPETVKEAQAARGEKLPSDLAELVRLGRALTGLPFILDELAQYPADDPVTLAKALDSTSSIFPATGPSRLSGPWPQESPPEPSDEQDPTEAKRTSLEPSRETSRAYQAVEEWLPPVEPQIRAYVGRELVRQWFPGGQLTPRLREAIEDLRDDMYRRFGVDMPGVRFHDSSWLPTLRDWEFSLVMLDQSHTDADAEPPVTEPGMPVERLTEALALRAHRFRTYWVDADYVERQLSPLDDALRDWLLSRYSLTDLKILLRRVAYPTNEELGLYPLTPDGEHIPAPAQNSIRHLPWLLGSLVFWTRFEDPLDAESLSQRLQDTQQARLENTNTDPLAESEVEEIRSGLENLENLRLDQAQKDFGAAIRRDQTKAIEGFLALYPAYMEKRLSASIEEHCRDPQNAWLSREERLYLDDLLAESPTTGQSEHPLGRELCLFYAYPADARPVRRMHLLKDLLTRFKSQEDLDAEPAAGFARAVLASHDSIQDSPEIRSQAIDLLKRAILDLDDEQSVSAFFQLQKICGNPGPNNWCWEALKEIADLRPDGDIPLLLAAGLSDRQRREDLLLAIELANRSEEHTRRKANLSPDDSASRLDLARLCRAAAQSSLAWLGDKDLLAESEATLRGLLESKDVGSSAFVSLLKILIAEERLEEALAIIEKVSERWPNTAAFYTLKLLVNLLAPDAEAVAAVADEVMEKASDKSDALFTSSVARILVGHEEAERTARGFLETDHDYVEFVAMMLYAFMSGEAKADADLLLQERWSRIDPATWKQRLTGGDGRVWQEKLIGYCRGEIPEAEIFGALQDDEAFAASDLSRLPFPREALQCEAYFYDAMLAKAGGDKQRMMESLRKTVKTGYGSYNEYSMAKFLLRREGGE